MWAFRHISPIYKGILPIVGNSMTTSNIANLVPQDLIYLVIRPLLNNVIDNFEL